MHSPGTGTCSLTVQVGPTKPILSGRNESRSEQSPYRTLKSTRPDVGGSDILAPFPVTKFLVNYLGRSVPALLSLIGQAGIGRPAGMGRGDSAGYIGKALLGPMVPVLMACHLGIVADTVVLGVVGPEFLVSWDHGPLSPF